MANTQIFEIPITKTSVDGTELLECQNVGGGADSSAQISVNTILNNYSAYRDGFFDYNDLATATTPFVHSGSGGYLPLPNDTLGAYTQTAYKPLGMSDIWDSATNQFDFSELSVGDMVEIRVDIALTTNTNNQESSVALALGIGSISEHILPIAHVSFKNSGTYQGARYIGFYMGGDDIINSPAEIQIDSDSTLSVRVHGWYVRVTRRFL